MLIREVTLDGLIDALLIEWHVHRSGYRMAAGHRSSSASTDNYRTPTHHDWKNGAQDERADQLRMRGICEAMDAVPDFPLRWRTALEFQARNLHCGNRVWSCSVLPKGEELRVLLLEARNKLAIELAKRSIIDLRRRSPE